MRITRESNDGDVKITTIFEKPLFSKLDIEKCKTVFIVKLATLSKEHVESVNSKNLSPRRRDRRLNKLLDKNKTHEIIFKIMNPSNDVLTQNTVTIFRHSEDNEKLYNYIISIIKKNTAVQNYELLRELELDEREF